MNKRESLNELSNLLYNISGIRFSYDEEDAARVSEEKILEIMTRLKSRLSASEIMNQYLSGYISSEEAKSLLLEDHHEIGDKSDIYLLSFDDDYDSASISVVKELIDERTVIVKVDKKAMFIICPKDRETGFSEYESFAASLIDTLNTEALQKVRICFDRTTDSFEEIPMIARHIAQGFRIGMIFDPTVSVISYHDLGISKLIYNLPEKVCRDFLNDSLPKMDLKKIDPETRHIVDTYFDSGLNIAEASRILYMHRNTLVYRLDKFSNENGVDIRSFDGAVLCKVGMMISDYLKFSKGRQ